MPATRPRRIVRRAVMVLAGAVLLVGLASVWLAKHESSEVQRSRALRLGMSVAEVRTIMGDENGAETIKGGNTPVLVVHYGRLTYKFKGLRSRIGLPNNEMRWPVRVHYSRGPQGWYVVRIERGDEVEEAPAQ